MDWRYTDANDMKGFHGYSFQENFLAFYLAISFMFYSFSPRYRDFRFASTIVNRQSSIDNHKSYTLCQPAFPTVVMLHIPVTLLSHGSES